VLTIGPADAARTTRWRHGPQDRLEAAGDRGTEPLAAIRLGRSVASTWLGRSVASIWLGHHTRPKQSFVLSVEVRPEHRGRGFGKAAMLVGEDSCLAAGDHYLGLNVFVHNTIATNLCCRLGYTILDEPAQKTSPR
jgi:GNAT superfamily N-acetyltransferase